MPLVLVERIASGLRSAFHLAPEIALQLQILDHGFDHPVAVADLIEIVLEIAGLNQRDLVISEKSRRPLLGRILDPFKRGRVPIRLAWHNNIQQQRRDARVRKMRRDARTHGSSAQHRDTTNCSHARPL